MKVITFVIYDFCNLLKVKNCIMRNVFMKNMFMTNIL